MVTRIGNTKTAIVCNCNTRKVIYLHLSVGVNSPSYTKSNLSQITIIDMDILT